MRIGRQFSATESPAATDLRVGDRFFRLTDMAEIRRGYVDPPSTLFRYRGQDAVCLAVGMMAGANIIDFGAALDDVMAAARASLPIGIDFHQAAQQPHVVDEAVSHFLQALLKAVLIVLAVSFSSLGPRAGLVVALTIPLVPAITFVVMHYAGLPR